MARDLAPHRTRGRRRPAMPPRPVAWAAAAVLATTALSSCGFDYATDQIYNASVGTNHRTGDVDILSAVVVSSSDGQGTFVATFNNNSASVADTVTSLEAGPDSSGLQISGFAPIEVPATGFVNIADTEQIKVTGDFIAGDYVDLTVDLERGEPVDMSVPVVAATDEYQGLDVTATGTATSTATATAVPSASESASASSDG